MRGLTIRLTTLLTEPCCVLVGYSNEGCDENGDGQVTFDDIPAGTWKVRQTRVQAGYPAVSDVGCDQDLVDGQIDFLDVLAGNHAIVVTRLPAGYTVANPNDLHLRIDATGDPANRFVVVSLQRGGV